MRVSGHTHRSHYACVGGGRWKRNSVALCCGWCLCWSLFHWWCRWVPAPVLGPVLGHPGPHPPAGGQTRSLSPMFLLPQKSLHPRHRETQMLLAPSDLSLPAQQEVGGGHFVVLLAGQGLFDFFSCVAHTHHHLWETRDGEEVQCPDTLPFHSFLHRISNAYSLACPVSTPPTAQSILIFLGRTFLPGSDHLADSPTAPSPRGRQKSQVWPIRVFHLHSHSDWFRDSQWGPV